MTTLPLPPLPIKAMCCGVCTAPAAAVVTTRHGVIGACIPHIRLVTRLGR
jgi:hypothetical protein